MSELFSPAGLFDTNVWITAHRELCPPDIFPGVWKKLASAAQESVIACPRAIMDEIAAKDDAVNKWVSQHKKGLMLPFTDVKLARKVEEDLLPRLQEKHSGLSKTAADYYLLAWGKVLRCPVVTLENKIPKVGMEEDVKCMNLFAFMRQQGWEF